MSLQPLFNIMSTLFNGELETIIIIRWLANIVQFNTNRFNILSLSITSTEYINDITHNNEVINTCIESVVELFRKTLEKYTISNKLEVLHSTDSITNYNSNKNYITINNRLYSTGLNKKYGNSILTFKTRVSNNRMNIVYDRHDIITRLIMSDNFVTMFLQYLIDYNLETPYECSLTVIDMKLIEECNKYSKDKSIRRNVYGLRISIKNMRLTRNDYNRIRALSNVSWYSNYITCYDNNYMLIDNLHTKDYFYMDIALINMYKLFT